MPSKEEMKVIEKAAMFDFRLVVKQSEKETYTREELLDLIDTVVLSKDQEQ